MFLSCGNLGFNHGADRFEKPAQALLGNQLTEEQKQISEKLDFLFTDMNRNGIFNGSVIVSKAGKVLYQKAIGLSDKQNNVMLSDSSMFQLASVSKVITATAVLMLHERKMLNIEDDFENFFPDFPYKDVKIKDLLSHRSGLPNYMYALNDEICRPDHKMNNEEMYRCLLSKKAAPYLKPNSRFNYSNTNYALLALLIEKVSGKSYSQFLKEELFEPLGMQHTATIDVLDLDAKHITKPYDNRWRPINFEAGDFVLGDKSIYSTPYDLFLFSEALYQNKIIKKESQEMAYTAFSKEKRLSNYGYGWRLKNFKDPENKEVYHNGWWHGYRSSFHRRLKDTLTVVILSNQLNSSAYQTQKVYDIVDNTVSLDLTADEE